jgi:hypothetical protein
LIIDKARVKKLIIRDAFGRLIGKLSDNRADMEAGCTVEVIPDLSDPPKYIAMRGDVLYYIDQPDQKYMVTQADQQFFTMVPVRINQINQELIFETEHSRTYPNSSEHGSLDAYGINIEFRGADHIGDDKKT